MALKSQVNDLLQNDKEDFSCIHDPYGVWPQHPQESQEQASLRLAHIMAWYLIQMSKYIEENIRSSDVHNSERTREFRGELAAVFHFNMPMDELSHPRPQLKSRRNGLNDSFDCCWAILNYKSWIPHMMSWEKKLEYLAHSKKKAIGHGTKSPTVTMPRPNYGMLSQQVSPSSPQQTTIVSAPIQVTVIWNKDQATRLNPELRCAVLGVAADRRTIAASEQVSMWDPRFATRGPHSET